MWYTAGNTKLFFSQTHRKLDSPQRDPLSNIHLKPVWISVSFLWFMPKNDFCRFFLYSILQRNSILGYYRGQWRYHILKCKSTFRNNDLFFCRIRKILCHFAKLKARIQNPLSDWSQYKPFPRYAFKALKSFFVITIVFSVGLNKLSVTFSSSMREFRIWSQNYSRICHSRDTRSTC